MSLLTLYITIDFKHIIINIMQDKHKRNHGPGNHGYKKEGHGKYGHGNDSHEKSSRKYGQRDKNHGIGFRHMSKQQRMARLNQRQKQRKQRKDKLEKNDISKDQQRWFQKIMKRRDKHWNNMPQEYKIASIQQLRRKKMKREEDQERFIFEGMSKQQIIQVQEKQQEKIAETFQMPIQYQIDEDEAVSRGFSSELAIKRSKKQELPTSPTQALIITSSENISEKYGEQASSPLLTKQKNVKEKNISSKKKTHDSTFLPRLKKVKNDRNLMERYFRKQFSLTGILQCHQRSPINKIHVLNFIKQFFSYQDRELAIIYYGGHGKKPSGNWVIEDKSYSFDNNSIENQQITPYQIFQLWKGRPRPQNLKFLLLIIDSCYSGNWIHQLEGWVDIQQKEEQQDTTISSISIIAASSMTQEALEKGKYGVFTSWFYSQLHDDQKSKQIKEISNQNKITAERLLHKNSVKFLIQNMGQNQQKNKEDNQQKKQSQSEGQVESSKKNEKQKPFQQTASWKTYSMQFLQNYPDFQKIWINYNIQKRPLNNSQGSFRYEGEVNQNDQFHGLGVLKKSYKKNVNGQEIQFFLTQYDGEWLNGKRNGRGVYYEYQQQFEVIKRVQGKWCNGLLCKEYRHYEYSAQSKIFQGDQMSPKTLNWPHTFIGKQKQKNSPNGIILNWNPILQNDKPIAFRLSDGIVKYYIYNDGTYFHGRTYDNLKKLKGKIYKTRQILCQDQFFEEQKQQKMLMQGQWSPEGQIKKGTFYKTIDGSQLKIHYNKDQVKPVFQIAQIIYAKLKQQKTNKSQ